MTTRYQPNMDAIAESRKDKAQPPTEQVGVAAPAQKVEGQAAKKADLAGNTQIGNVAVRGRDVAGLLQAVPDVSLSDASVRPRAGGGGGGAGQPTTWKFDPAVSALVGRMRRGASAGADESRFVIGGEAYIRLTLTNYSPQSIAQLRDLGLTITRQERGDVSGHLPPALLERVAQLPFVMWIAPQASASPRATKK